MDFYRELAQSAKAQNQSVLEAACGTGRVAIRLAEEGVKVVGTDLDAAMLEIARRKNAHVRWVRGDMRALDLGETFGLIILPGHSFQFMCTPEDQVAALETFIRHLVPGGTLADYVSGTSGDGELRVRVRCTRSTGSFFSSGDLMTIVYDR